MLGAVVTDPATEDGDIGMLFLSPQGYFEMCGDSTFSGIACVIDSGIITCPDPNANVLIKLDTVAGRVDVHVKLKNGEPVEITFNNVPSFALGSQTLKIPGTGEIEAWVAYGGLLYAFVEAKQVGITSLRETPRDKLLDVGTKVWQAARDQTSISFSKGDKSSPIDLITLWEPLGQERGARVANFYAPQTTGRTPSGTGLAARVAIETSAGRLARGESFIHESLLGLRFSARVVNESASDRHGHTGCVPAVTARSFLMGVNQWVLHPEDPFCNGFIF